MDEEWYWSTDGRQFGPMSFGELQAAYQAGRFGAQDLVWRTGYAEWISASRVPGLVSTHSYAPPPPPITFNLGSMSSEQIGAGLCAVLLGSLGVHKFLLGMITPGLILLGITLATCGLGAVITSVIGLVEGIIYLTRPPAEFHQRYIVEKREWF